MEKDIPQIAQVHIYPDGSVLRGLLIVLEYYYFYNLVGNIVNICIYNY